MRGINVDFFPFLCVRVPLDFIGMNEASIAPASWGHCVAKFDVEAKFLFFFEAEVALKMDLSVCIRIFDNVAKKVYLSAMCVLLYELVFALGIANSNVLPL